MLCYKCNTENADGRKYCRECGSLIVQFCAKCGSGNHLTDKYCGGCGESITRATISENAGQPVEIPSQIPAGKYSSEDISELFHEAGQKPHKKKEIKKTEEVSQDLLDSIFSSDENNSNAK